RSLSVLIMPALPTPPGTSGFHVKGVVYAGIKNRLAQEPALAAKLRAEITDPALIKFYDQLFLTSGWYDVFPVVPLVAAQARALGVSFDTAAAEAARARVTEDLSTIYRAFIRAASPEQLAPRLVRGFSRYLDFGAAEVKTAAPGSIEIVTRDMPVFLLPWYMPVAGTFFRIALESVGARDVRVSWRAPEDSGERKDLALCLIQVSLAWR
ncbi:MAG TPA: hypothetical protein VLS89_18090, partial [Candidatus Nanopelagicales bacterium]|nr:hypothetical protein [Candidatus Nanopelagicales bacterium]